MQEKSLRAFWNDKGTKQDVYNYLIEFLQATAINKVFKKEDTTAVGEAKEILDKAFENLDNLFEPKASKKEPINQSR
jgi:hypothetical protein